MQPRPAPTRLPVLSAHPAHPADLASGGPLPRLPGLPGLRAAVRRILGALCAAGVGAVSAQTAPQTLPAAAPAVGPRAAEALQRFRFDHTPSVLDKAVRPRHYRLTLDLDPAREDFEGEVTLTLALRQARAQLELHAHELLPQDAWLHGPRGRRALEVQPDAARQTWRLRLRDGAALPAGTQRVTLRYRGVVHAQGRGLYHATLPGSAPPQRMLATQLQAIHARTLFPGFDEPVFRAPFELTLRTPAGLEALSNMPRRRLVTLADGRLAHHFPPTPAMPSYLVAVAVGRWDVLEGRAAGVPLRILTAPGKREQARYAMQVTEQLLPDFSHWFGQPYALPRLDQLAVPGTRRGAMEDWGLISYAENLLLYDPARSSPHTRRWIFNLVAHEVAHQWFGNLVTAASWSEIWLNEAFATWIAAKVTDRHNPDWQVRLNDRLEIDASMATDATDATRAIRSGPVSEQRVWDVFDDITYTKGGAVLGMLEQWLGEERFRRGLAAYLRERRLSNATAGDLWFHIGRAAGQDVAAVARSWTDQRGFPLVGVESRCEGGSTEVTLTQQRFLPDGVPVTAGTAAGPAGDAAAPPPPLWRIPVQLAQGEALHRHLLDGAQARLRLPGCGELPIVANAGGVGYYRVAYAPAQRAALLQRLPTLAPADRLVLLTDTAALVQAGRVPARELVEALGRVPQAEGPGRAALWRLLLERFTALDQALAGLPAQAALRGAAGRLVGAELQRLGWQPRPGEDAETEALRGDLIRRLAQLGDAATIAQARDRLARAQPADGAAAEPLPASLRDALIRAAGAGAGAEEQRDLRRRLQQAGGEEERWTLAGALVLGRSADEARELLDWALQAGLPPNVATALPRMLAGRAGQVEAAYAQVRANWAAWSALAGPQGRRYLLPGMAEHAVGHDWAQRVRDDQVQLLGPDEAAPAGPAARAAAQILARTALREREGDSLAAAFERLAR